MARSFINDTNGIILQQSSGDANAPTSITRQIVANGQVFGSYGFAQPSGTHTNPAINFNNLPPGMVLSASTYDASFQPINSGYPSASVGSYLVQTGDTLQAIAQSAYGDRQLWFVIAQANRLMSDADLKVGMSLIIPSKVGSVHNTSDTFKPYNPGELIGDTAPTLPVPQNDDDECGGLGQLIMIVVAVVVTYFTAGATSGFFAGAFGATGGAIATGAVAAAAGSIASQLVGNALGIVDGFSWKAVALAAIAGGVGGGVDAAFGLGDTVLRAVIKNAVTQGIGVATGLQDSFDWRGVAAAGIDAGVGYGITDSIMGAEQAGPVRPGETLPRIGGLVQDWGSGAGARFAGAALVGLAAGTAASLARGGRVNITQMATDVFGNLVGSSLANAMQPAAPAPQGVGPYSSRDYRNGMDIDSDNANATNNPPAYTGGNDFANDVARRKQENAWWNNAASGKDKQIEEVSKPEDSSTALIRNEPPAPRSVRAADFGGSLERIARSELGSGASQGEINNYVGQLFEINGISNARRIGANQGILLPGADTPNATSGLSQYGKDIVTGERIKEQARAEAEFKRQQAAQQAQSSTSQGMSSDEAYAIYMASGGRSGSYARALGSGCAPPYGAGASNVPTMSYDALGNMTGVSPEFGGYTGGEPSEGMRAVGSVFKGAGKAVLLGLAELPLQVADVVTAGYNVAAGTSYPVNNSMMGKMAANGAGTGELLWETTKNTASIIPLVGVGRASFNGTQAGWRLPFERLMPPAVVAALLAILCFPSVNVVFSMNYIALCADSMPAICSFSS